MDSRGERPAPPSWYNTSEVKVERIPGKVTITGPVDMAALGKVRKRRRNWRKRTNYTNHMDFIWDGSAETDNGPGVPVRNALGVVVAEVPRATPTAHVAQASSAAAATSHNLREKTTTEEEKQGFVDCRDDTPQAMDEQEMPGEPVQPSIYEEPQQRAAAAIHAQVETAPYEEETDFGVEEEDL
eukprot:4436897-Amphidinium_carterae.1